MIAIEALKATLTIEDVRKATAAMNGARAKIPIDLELHSYLTSVIARMMQDESDGGRVSCVFAALHTLLEIGIETGRQLGLREASAIVREVRDETQARRAAKEGNEDGNQER